MDPEKEAFDIEMNLDADAERELRAQEEKCKLIAQQHNEQEDAWLYIKEE